MEYPATEIGGVIKTLTQGSPEQQESALSNYFLPNATFPDPRCRPTSLSRSAVTSSSGADSLWLAISMYRWYRTLSPHLDIKVDRVDFDQQSGLLYVSLRQTFAVWFIPLYKAPVRLVSVLQLTQQSPPRIEDVKGANQASEDSPRTMKPENRKPKYYIASQEDFYPVTDYLQFLMPGFGRCLWLVWCLWSFWMLVLGSAVILPFYLVLNRMPKRK
ncbi:hypothetical protein BGZ63DRAFT_419994 [Mariannaea sp. PMI_226]|nr:hypothetical protein BGZ63DRAFT_419994 [Mariannaea sp. PMI_226]